MQDSIGAIRLLVHLRCDIGTGRAVEIAFPPSIPASLHGRRLTLFRPCRTLSPSSSAVSEPRRASSCSTVHATVLLPLPLRPVNQTTHPRCPSNRSFCSLHQVEVSSGTKIYAAGTSSPDLYAVEA